MRRTLAAAALALLLTACGSASDGSGQAAERPGRPSAQQVRDRAAQVAREWPGSAAEQAWSGGYYPLASRQEWLPSDAFTHGGKAAYLGGLFEVATELPPTEATAEVVWAYGQRLAVPMVSPRQVLDGLARGQAPCGTGCETPLKVTKVARGSRAVATSRGQATVPVWEFTMAGYQEPFAYPAVAAQQSGPPEPVRGEWSGHRVAYVSVSPDGLTVTGAMDTGSCDEITSTEAYETDHAVVLLGFTTRPRKVCDLALRTRSVTVRLARPLDARVVLDLATGAPQAGR